MKVIRIILLFLIVIGIGLLLTQKIWVEPLVRMILSHEDTLVVEVHQPVVDNTKKVSNSDGLVCRNEGDYVVMSKQVPGFVGTNILVKHKAYASQTFPCTYVVGSNDFEIKNNSAEYFLALAGNYLVIDSGTAPPPRGLIVYDLTKKIKIFTDRYSTPFSVKHNALDYWAPTSEKPTLTNCPKLTEYTSGGLGALIEAHVTVDLLVLSKKDSGDRRCSATQ